MNKLLQMNIITFVLMAYIKTCGSGRVPYIMKSHEFNKLK